MGWAYLATGRSSPWAPVPHKKGVSAIAEAALTAGPQRRVRCLCRPRPGGDSARQRSGISRA
eukprot:14606-Chlamydomonas_euryale.AAC.1